MFNLLQPGQHQRLDQQLKIARQVRASSMMPDSSRSLTPSGCGAGRGRVAKGKAERCAEAPLAKNGRRPRSAPPAMNLAITSNPDRLSNQPPAGRRWSPQRSATSLKVRTRPAAQRVVPTIAAGHSVELAVPDAVGQHRRGRSPRPSAAGRPSGQLEAAGVGQLLGDLSHTATARWVQTGSLNPRVGSDAEPTLPKRRAPAGTAAKIPVVDGEGTCVKAIWAS